ncbi:3-oxoacyl-ACP synthase III family protein [Sphingomonas sp. SUN039]|uniref:3-oxoacyl-ACP synthase III family protein n=1 Tax=Sphingomonas sp. SUN039 TaxID=2937787 RepID=UPI0021645389|nr:3-oxoacyl-[acyl-carrier-protein] synthase III C-terminal domain-containing protein [Sphingomonas sp. SUN039]UVO53482.1 3-oxoacyl-ACP synthase [Sphingomonas sp. SUN039]
MTSAPTTVAPWLSTGRLAVLGTGTALPGAPVETDALIDHMANRFGLNRRGEARAISRRMAIRSRHFCRPFDARDEVARPGQSNPDLVASAVLSALDDAGLTVDDIGYLIGHTTTPLQPIPSNIALAADRLGYRGPHLELRQACTGFANASMIAFGLLSVPDAKPVVLVGSETGSLWFDPAHAIDDTSQLVNLMQMGDGAAAIVLGPAADTGPVLHAAWFGALGLGKAPGLHVRHGATEFDHDYAAILASGPALFDAGVASARLQGISLESADIIVPHQVSGRVATQIEQRFGLAPGDAFTCANRLGNTGSAAMWMALSELRRDGLAQGARILALGAEATKFMYGGFVYDHPRS